MSSNRTGVRRALSTRTKIIFEERLLSVMGPAEAVFLQKIINLDDSPGAVRDGKGYILCTTNFLNNAYWPERTQNYLIRRLTLRGVLTARRAVWPGHGTRPFRWVRVDYGVLESVLKENKSTNDDKQYQDVMTRTYGRLSSNPTDYLEKKEHCPVPKAEPDRGEVMFDSVAPPCPTTTKIPYKEEDLARAERLKEIVKSRMTCGWRRAAWARHMALLREQVGGVRIDLALDWYAANVGKGYTPVAYCAGSFRKKFPNVEAAMARDQKRNPVVEVSPEADRIAKRLKALGWPKGAGEGLATPVQISIDNVADLKERLVRWMNDSLWRRDSAAVRFAAKLLNGELRDPAHVVEVWFKRVHQNISGWGGWSGRLDGFILRHDHHDFTADMRQLASKWAGSKHGPALWDSLVKELYK